MTSVDELLDQAEEPPPPNRGWLLAVLVAIVSFVVWILVGDFIGRAQSTPSVQPSVTVTVTATVIASGTAVVVPSPSPEPSTVAVAPTAAAPGGTELLSFAGSGKRTSQTFAVSRTSFKLSYAYSCAAFGSTGAFQVNLQRGPVQVDLLTNALGKAGSDVVRAEDGPGIFYLLINSPCAWAVRVSQ